MCICLRQGYSRLLSVKIFDFEDVSAIQYDRFYTEVLSVFSEGKGEKHDIE